MNLDNMSSIPITPSEVRKRVEVLTPKITIELNKSITARFNEKTGTSIVTKTMISNLFKSRFLAPADVEKIVKLYDSNWEVTYINGCLSFKAR